MARTRSLQRRYEVTLEWRDHAVNLKTEKRIMAARKGETFTFIYRVDSVGYTNFAEAIVATEPYGNAEGAIIAIRGNWGSAREKPFFIYSPKGVRLGSFATLADAAKTAKQFEAQFPPLSADKIERRREAYENAVEIRKEAAKRRLIEREKAKILEEIKLKKLRAKDAARVGDVAGSW